MNTINRIALLGVAEGEITRRLESEILRLERTSQLPVATSMAQMRARLCGISPSVILLDECMLRSIPLPDIVREVERHCTPGSDGKPGPAVRFGALHRLRRG